MLFEQSVFLSHSEGKLDNSLMDFFLPLGAIRDEEGPMWDYKVGYCNPKCPIGEASELLCDVIKDVAGLFNCFGGYLIYAYRDDQAPLFQSIINGDEFDSKCDRYLKSRIPTARLGLKGTLDGNLQNILFIHVSKRSAEMPPVAFVRNSVEKAGKFIFRLGDIVLRYGTRTEIINQRQDLLVFAFGERKQSMGEVPTRLNELDNNLPPRDPNLIKFIGRRGYLIELWNWLADVRNPLKVLTALGGTGKTAIAYEFCEQLVKARGSIFSKIIWLTAKSQTYAAILQQYVSTTRTDFVDIDSFLDALLREIGCLETDFEDFENIEDKLDFAKELISSVGVLLVIDDLDTLDNVKQIELFSRIAQLFDQSQSGRSGSKVLFTSRLEPNTGANRLIRVAGFDKEETRKYVDSLVTHLSGPSMVTKPAWGDDVQSHLEGLHEASKGSPIFVASILRLVSFGENITAVIDKWRGKDGEEVRKFAFNREIGNLDYADWRVLYVLQLLSSSSFEEIREILEEDRQRLQKSLSALSQYHLFSGGNNPATGVQISVPEPIRLMVDITQDNLRKDDAEELRRACARISKQTDGQSDVGRAIRNIVLLWRRQLYDRALTEAQIRVREFPRSGDMSCILGRTHLYQTNPDFEAADNAFKDAYQKKCERTELLEYWSLAKLKRGDIAGLQRITGGANKEPVQGVTLLYRLAGQYRIALQRENRDDNTQALESYQQLRKEVVSSLRSGRTDPVTAEIKRLGAEVSNYIIEVARKAYQGQRAVPERIFALIVENCEDGLPPLRNIREPVAALVVSTQRLFGRNRLDGRLRSSFETRRRDLAVVKKEVSASLNSQHPLVLQLDKADRAFADMLAYKRT